MTFDEYQLEVVRTAASTQGPLGLAVFGLGVAGEAGEVADLIKKVVGQGHELDEDKLLKELGDVLWYVTAIAERTGFSLAQVAELNVKKLRKRYPDGFSEEASKRRQE